MIIEKERYRLYCEQKKNLPLFFQPYWLDAVSVGCEWDVCIARDGDGNVKGVFPYFTKRKRGFKGVTMPQMTPWLGMILEYPPKQSKTHSRYSFEKNTVQELEAMLPDHSYFNVNFHPKFRNWLPLKWKNYKQTMQVTYVLEDISDHKKLLEGYKGSVRTDLKKARLKTKIESSDDIDFFYDLNKKTFDRQGIEIPYSKQLMRNIDEALAPRKKRHIWLARDLDGVVYSGVYIAYDEETAYCLAIASDPDYRYSGAISMLLDHAIAEAAFKVNRFDFEGGNLEKIESLFRAFGAEQDLYSRIYRSKNKFTDAVLTLIGKF